VAIFEDGMLRGGFKWVTQHVNATGSSDCPEAYDLEEIGTVWKELVTAANRIDPNIDQRKTRLIEMTLDLLWQLQDLVKQITALCCTVLSLDTEVVLSDKRAHNPRGHGRDELFTTEPEDANTWSAITNAVASADDDYREGAD
jgi:hypothetical protein